ncbi:MAG: hypothetical protein FJ215_09070 [Ignavibacteria bacterium]|nr:hypothetical protein [Ignavibacteria bacterium]
MTTNPSQNDDVRIMIDHDALDSGAFQWKWIVLGVIVGLIVTGSSLFVLSALLPIEPLQMLGMVIGFVLGGLVIGYFSTGIFTREVLVSALALLGIVAGLLAIDERLGLMGREAMLYWAVLNLCSALLGGWIGRRRLADLLEAQENTYAYLRFPWRLVGTSLSVGLGFNLMFLFVLKPLFVINENVVHIGMLAGFLASGLVLGYRSQRMSMREPALVGAVLVFLCGVLLWLEATTRISVLVFHLAIGFLLVFGGAWFGERFRQLLTKPII